MPSSRFRSLLNLNELGTVKVHFRNSRLYLMALCQVFDSGSILSSVSRCVKAVAKTLKHEGTTTSESITELMPLMKRFMRSHGMC